MIEASIDTITISADIGKGYPVKGDPGDNGYVHIAYANSAEGKDFTLTPESGKTYEFLGQYTDNTETASTEWSDYKWSWLTDEASRQAAETARTAAETARETAEESRTDAEKTRVTAESERMEAESKRANAETARAAAEETRVINEDGRTDDEARRRDAENRRASTEQAREANETARVAAETKRETDSAAAVNAANTAAANAQSTADTVQAKLDAGELKGDKGDKGDTGAQGIQGIQGEKGDSGYSPTATVTQTDTGATVTVTDAAGTTTANIANGSDAPQIDDTAISTENPWSSKNIIDRICPEITGTGNPVVLENVIEGYPLDIDASWGIQQEGEGTPSVTNIRPFVSRNSVTINANGNDTILQLPETMYAGSARTNGEVKKTYAAKVIDGVEVKFSQSDVYWNLPQHSIPGTAASDVDCSHFSGLIANYIFDFAFLKTTDNPWIAETFASVEEMNTYCQEQNAAGTPVTIAYKLKEPATLTTASAAIYTISGTNTLTTDADTLTASAREDPTKTIANLTDRISALEAAATNISEV